MEIRVVHFSSKLYIHVCMKIGSNVTKKVSGTVQ